MSTLQPGDYVRHAAKHEWGFGRVTEVTGLVIRASVPGVRVGELVSIAPAEATAGTGARLDAEVVGFRGDEVVLMPFGEPTGIGPDALVTPTGGPFSIAVSDRLLGRVLDGLGRPIDGGGPIPDARDWAVELGQRTG